MMYHVSSSYSWQTPNESEGDYHTKIFFGGETCMEVHLYNIQKYSCVHYSKIVEDRAKRHMEA